MPKQHPDSVVLASCHAGLVLAADNGNDGSTKLPTFTLTAYTGGKMDVGYFLPVVMDLAGMAPLEGPIPSLREHDPECIVGHINEAKSDGKTLQAFGVISGTSEDALEVPANSKNGYPWQASIGATVQSFEELGNDGTAEVNGQTVTGPCLIARQWKLKEVSFVAIGASTGTSAKIAASAHQNSNTEPTMPENTPPAAVNAADPIKDAVAAHQRIADIKAAAKGDDAIVASALKDGWDVGRVSAEVELKAARARATPPASTADAGAGDSDRADVITAAILIASGMQESKVGKHFSQETMNKAVSASMRGYGIGRLAGEVAASAGVRLPAGRLVDSDIRAALQADRQVLASGSSFSTVSLSGILGNVANKAMLAAYMASSDPWRRIASVSNTSNFKTYTRYRMQDIGALLKVGPSGELKHGTFSEDSYTNKLETRGKIVALTRQMIVDDDLGAFVAIPSGFGMRSAQAIEKEVYQTLLNPTTGGFYVTTTGATKNKFTGAGSALSSTSLATAETQLMNRVDDNGDPINIGAAVLLVNPALASTARKLYVSEKVKGSTDGEDANIFAGRFDPAVSAWLSNSQITGNSATVWLLLADPNMLSAVDVGFLNGAQTPTIQSAETDFNQLGIQWRAFIDFGVKEQDPLAVIWNVGA